ncbi:MAG: PLP-dependent transferase [Candidatus Eisenbacteria bacterium]|uniref:PLP-dependent transferase n=1 Tax=Eiseniibacteriota bacterium TaxID=2212470 RepID=A0A538SSB1_UNCEI|nr:MAG: PLP-dependent transferase [Candidatus Eisenbacteria bacterium]TMQ66208.1 MAG: PLP-dependent transferase [Candidatus Eisenbacteria bacterium]
MGFSTDAVHAGQEPDPVTGSVTVPIYQTSTYVQEELGKHKGFEYARTQNPTRFALEKNVATLERGARGFAFASGMAAITAVTYLLKSGDHVVASNNMYGGTYRLFEKVLTSYGLSFTYVNTGDLKATEAAFRPTTRMLFVETPTNPSMIVSDLRALAELARSRNALLVVDNTFMTPYFQRPIELGAHLVVHSTTKYLNGHSDMVGGIVISSDPAASERLQFVQNAAGAVPGPFDCWLCLRGIKTLALRMERHNQSALAIAEWLAGQSKLKKVFYPGLKNHPGHELHKRQASGFGGMIAFETGSIERGAAFLRATRLFALAESLGGVESLISHPATMTHASVPKSERESVGLTDGLVRISVGIEDLDDLIRDLEGALAAL